MEDNDIAYIGTYDIETGKIIEESVIDEVVTLGELGKGYGKVSIKDHEGPIPHVHIERKGESDICICLHENKFFDHGKYKGKLNGHKEKANFDDFMKSKMKNQNGKTRWEYAAEKWIEAYPDCPNNERLKKKPDYRTMTDTILDRKKK